MELEKDFYYKKSRLNQLRGFCNVVQCDCSGVKAAKKSHIEPAAISKQISSLERDLNLKLFNRARGRKLSLTKEGKMFYELAVKQIQGVDSLFNNFNSYIKETNQNTLNLGLHYSAATYIFPKIIGKLLKVKKFENLKINIFNIEMEEALEKLKSKELDLIFYPLISTELIPNEIEVKENIMYKQAIIFFKTHPLSKQKNISNKDIEKYDFLIRGKKTIFTITKFFNLKKANFDFVNATPEITIELIKNTNTITAIPEVYYTEGNLKLSQDIICKNINHLLPKSYFHIMTLKNSIMKDSIKWLIKELNKEKQL